MGNVEVWIVNINDRTLYHISEDLEIFVKLLSTLVYNPNLNLKSQRVRPDHERLGFQVRATQKEEYNYASRTNPVAACCKSWHARVVRLGFVFLHTHIPHKP